jgi:hypothetical protein
LRTSDRSASPERSLQRRVSFTEAIVKPRKNIEAQCFDALLELLELSANIVELLYAKPNPQQRSNYLFALAELDGGLKSWYGALPECLVWTVKNIATAPLPYFHLQYVPSRAPFWTRQAPSIMESPKQWTHVLKND